MFLDNNIEAIAYNFQNYCSIKARIKLFVDIRACKQRSGKISIPFYLHCGNINAKKYFWLYIAFTLSGSTDKLQRMFQFWMKPSINRMRIHHQALARNPPLGTSCKSCLFGTRKQLYSYMWVVNATGVEVSESANKGKEHFLNGLPKYCIRKIRDYVTHVWKQF